MHLFMGHIVSSLHILKKRDYLYTCVSLTYFLSLVYVSLFFLTSKIFPQNLFCFFLFYRGRGRGGGKLFLKPMLFIRRFVALHRGVASIFYRTDFFCVALVLYFFYPLLCMFTIYSLFELSLSIRDKNEEK